MFLGFMGYYCETQIDQCQSNPCLNGGLCRTLINSFKCDCPSGYTVSKIEFDSIDKKYFDFLGFNMFINDKLLFK